MRLPNPLYLGDGMAATDLLSPNSDVGYFPFTEEEYPMTLHIVLRTLEPNDGIVWVTDTLAGLGFGSTADVEKIVYLRESNVACSAWGDHAFTIRDEFVRWVKDGSPDLGNPDTVIKSLEAFSRHFRNKVLPALKPTSGIPGLILVVFGDKRPSAYFALLNTPPVASAIDGNLWAGDDFSPAKIFADYYYALSKKSVRDALTFGIHGLRLAHKTKASYIGSPNAWAYRKGEFARLSREELAEYERISESMDSKILNYEASSSAIVQM
jgi:hypothetical protein